MARRISIDAGTDYVVNYIVASSKRMKFDSAVIGDTEYFLCPALKRRGDAKSDIILTFDALGTQPSTFGPSCEFDGINVISDKIAISLSVIAGDNHTVIIPRCHNVLFYVKKA